MTIDHLVYATPDLDAGVAAFAELTGVEPARGGRHDTGTHNALASLGDGVYLEIVAPQPDTTSSHPWVEFCRSLDAPAMLTWCNRPTMALEEVADASSAHGFATGAPFAMSRVTPEGATLAWRLLLAGDGPTRSAIPFHIDWGTTPHPAVSAPAGVTLMSFTVRTPGAESLARWVEHVAGLGPTVEAADTLSFSVELATPNGTVSLS